jgi:hypothetical protein
MKKLLLICLVALTAATAQSPTEKKISYHTDRKSVQYVVIDLAKIVELDYDWDKSADQTDPERRRWVDDLTIENKSFDEAMKSVLEPVHLRYEIEDNKIVLYRQ